MLDLTVMVVTRQIVAIGLTEANTNAAANFYKKLRWQANCAGASARRIQNALQELKYTNVFATNNFDKLRISISERTLAWHKRYRAGQFRMRACSKDCQPHSLENRIGRAQPSLPRKNVIDQVHPHARSKLGSEVLNRFSFEQYLTLMQRKKML